MRELPHGVVAIGLEAGPLSQWLYKGLTEAGFETVLMETKQVKSVLKAMPIKTDRRHAESIARLLQSGPREADRMGRACAVALATLVGAAGVDRAVPDPTRAIRAHPPS